MKRIAVFVLFVGLVAASARADNEIQYEGTFGVQGNGDVAVVMHLTMPMAKYQKLRDSVSNLYLMMRDLASARANTEVVDKKPEWDDATRTLSFSMKWLGGARNMGNRWELDVPKGTVFSNYDEAKRTMFFNAAGGGALGAVVGSEKLVFPAESRNVAWDNSRRIVSWEMPEPKRAGGGMMLWAAAGVLLLAGAGMVAASFRSAPKTE